MSLKINNLLLPWFALILLLSNSCETTSSPSLSNQKGTLDDNIYQWINAYRAKEQLQPLKRKNNLDRLARQHAIMISENPNIEHSHLNQALRVKALKIYHCDVEPIYFQGQLPQGKEPAFALIQQWNQSSKTKNTLASKWTQLGVGSTKNAKGEDIIIVLIADPQALGTSYLNSAQWR